MQLGAKEPPLHGRRISEGRTESTQADAVRPEGEWVVGQEPDDDRSFEILRPGCQTAQRVAIGKIPILNSTRRTPLSSFTRLFNNLMILIRDGRLEGNG